MEYWQEGSTSTAVSTTLASDIVGQHNKIGGINFGAALVTLWLHNISETDVHYQTQSQPILFNSHLHNHLIQEAFVCYLSTSPYLPSGRIPRSYKTKTQHIFIVFPSQLHV